MAAVFLGTFALAMVAFVSATRLYKGFAEIQVQKGSADTIGLDGMRGGSGDAGEDAMESNITLQTEAQILQSESLALSVIKTLNLDKTPDFHPRASPIGWVLGLFAPKGTKDPSNVPLSEAPGRRSSAVKMFESRLKVKPVSGTRLIDIEYYSSDPHTAAAVVNLLVKNLTDYNFETRQSATAAASGWLGNQLSDLKSRPRRSRLIWLSWRRARAFSRSARPIARAGHRRILRCSINCRRPPRSFRRPSRRAC